MSSPSMRPSSTSASARFAGAVCLNLADFLEGAYELLVGLLQRFYVHYAALGLSGYLNAALVQLFSVGLEKSVGSRR